MRRLAVAWAAALYSHRAMASCGFHHNMCVLHEDYDRAERHKQYIGALSDDNALSQWGEHCDSCAEECRGHNAFFERRGGNGRVLS